MFSISFGEMAIVLLVVLLVVGPKRLPQMARFLGHLIGRVNRQAMSVKREIRREMDLEDLRQAKRETEESFKEVQVSVKESIKGVTAEEAAATPAMNDKPRVTSGG